jgi:putative ABC transport system substrate-binding protein
MRIRLRRRDFIGGAAAWPLAVRAQQGDRVRRIGVLMAYDENDPEGKLRYSAFTQALAGLGWTDGRKWSLAAEGLQLGEGSRRRFTVGILFRTS